MEKQPKISKIVFTPTDKIYKKHNQVKDLVEKLFGFDIDGIFVSNKSSLHDFLGVRDDVETIKDVVKKVRNIYGIDITPVKEDPIVDIVEFMQKKEVKFES